MPAASRSDPHALVVRSSEGSPFGSLVKRQDCSYSFSRSLGVGEGPDDQGYGGPPGSCILFGSGEARGQNEGHLVRQFRCTARSRQGKGRQERTQAPERCCRVHSCLPPGHPWPQLFMDRVSLPSPAWLQLYCWISGSPRNFTPLCLCSCCSFSQMPSPLSLSCHNLLILQGPARMPHIPLCSLPRVPGFVTCPSLHGLLTLHLYLSHCG